MVGIQYKGQESASLSAQAKHEGGLKKQALKTKAFQKEDEYRYIQPVCFLNIKVQMK